MSEYICNLEETKQLAATLAKNAQQGDCYCLEGDLGAGKTEFARSFIRSLVGEITVGSPTFNIVMSYEGYKHPIYHYDLYRIEDTAELAEIGLEDSLLNGISLIEWPEIAKGLLPKNRVEIRLEIVDEETRKITICKT